MLAIDTSGSMSATDVSAEPARGRRRRGPPLRRQAARRASRSGCCRSTRQARCSRRRRSITPPCSRRSTLSRCGGGTATGEAIYQSLAAIAAQPKAAQRQAAAAAIVLMSDGTPTIGRDGESPRADGGRGHRGREAGRACRSTRSRSARRAGTIEVQGEMRLGAGRSAGHAADRVGQRRQVVHRGDRARAQLGLRPDPQERRLRHRAPRHDRVVHGPRLSCCWSSPPAPRSCGASALSR